MTAGRGNGAGNGAATYHSRYECKYLISPFLVPSIRRFIEPFTEPDPYAARWEGFRYPICSLYLDTDDLLLFRQNVQGVKTRFKLRVRTYSDDPSTPAYLEVKHRHNNIVTKRRAAVDRQEARFLVDEGRWDPARSLAGAVRENIEYFTDRLSLISAKSVVKIKYMREAYAAPGGEPVRITFDTDLRHAVTLRPDLGHASGAWAVNHLDGVILEIKFTDVFPAWADDLVQLFDLKRQSLSKYARSVSHMISYGAASSLSLGGFTVPPVSVQP